MSKKEKKLIERRVKGEKGGLLALAVSLISSGAQLIVQDNLTGGIALLIAGVFLVILREHLKFSRWNHVDNYWRGKNYRKK